MECSKTEAKTVCEDRRKATLPDAALCLTEPIRRTMKCDGPGRRVDHRICGAGIPVARLTDAARVQERAGRERIRRVVAHAPRLRLVPGPKERRHVRVAGAAVRGLREGERCGGAPRIRHVFP